MAKLVEQQDDDNQAVITEVEAEGNRENNSYNAFCPVPSCRAQIYGENNSEIYQFLIDHMATAHVLKVEP